MSSMDGKFHLSLAEKIQMGFHSPYLLVPVPHGLFFPLRVHCVALAHDFHSDAWIPRSHLFGLFQCLLLYHSFAANTTVSTSFWPAHGKSSRFTFCWLSGLDFCHNFSFTQSKYVSLTVCSLFHPDRACSHFNTLLKVKVLFSHVWIDNAFHFVALSKLIKLFP